MLKAAIICLSVVICVFQPWMAVIFALFYLVNLQANKSIAEKEDYDKAFTEHKRQVQARLDDRVKEIFNDLEEDLEKIKNDAPVEQQRKSHLRLVK